MSHTVELRRGSLEVEWPTVGLATVIYASFLVLTYCHASVPWYVLIPLGGYLVAWHSSLLHELVHGHPTRNRRFNALLGSLPLLLWLPFEVYRAQHLKHHRDANLTDPLDDPESYYVTAATWQRLPEWRRRLLLLRNTLLGRLTIGSALVVSGFLRGQIRELIKGAPGVRRAWGVHLLGVAIVLGWLVLVAGMPLWQYVLLIVWPATSLMLVRSFLEHQATPEVEHRTVIVEAGPLMRLLFLNNNLHIVHHAKPAVPWYELPKVYAADRQGWRRRNGGYVFEGGYAEILRRFAFRAKEPPVHPFVLGGAAKTGQAAAS
jgi:fatty acid desaturase